MPGGVMMIAMACAWRGTFRTTLRRTFGTMLACCAMGSIALGVAPALADGEGGEGSLSGPALAGEAGGEGSLSGPALAGEAGGEGSLSGPAAAAQAGGESTFSGSTSAGEPDGMFSPALVIAGSPGEPEQLEAANVARLASPGEFVARQESATAYEGLSAGESEALAEEVMPTLIDDPEGGPPKLPADMSRTGFPTDFAESVSLPGGGHGVIESLTPIANETASGHAPINLTPESVGNHFEAKASFEGVSERAGGQLSEGVALPELGVKLTPVTREGQPLQGAGQISGASVFYGDSEDPKAGVVDVDTVAKLDADGTSLDTILRSQRSPQTLYFAVHVPAGAKLESDGHGGAQVLSAGQAIAEIPAPTAVDAAGTDVPIEMSIEQDTLVLNVPHKPGEYEAPITVDPQDYDTAFPNSWATFYDSNWHFNAWQPSNFEHYPGGANMVMRSLGYYGPGEYDELEYEAHGESSIDYIEEASRAAAGNQSGALTKLEFAYGPYWENGVTLGNAGEGYNWAATRLCVPTNSGTCGVGAINLDNEVRFQQVATQWGSEYFFMEVNWATVGIRQERGPEASFNNYEANLSRDSSRENVLYGSNKWLGEHSGAFEVLTHDPGLGVSNLKVRDMSGGSSWEYSEPVLAEGRCSGVWCNPEEHAAFPYGAGMVEGKNTIELCAEDDAHMWACPTVTVDVDNAKPSSIKLKGIAETGAEVSATTQQVTVEATDQTSGIKSIAVSVDGKEIASPAGSCTPGVCTASRAVTIHGEELGGGEHHILVTATDYADNVLTKEFTFAVRNATPVDLGPGTLDPVTGQFSLSAEDVSVEGAGHVSRVYRSRALTAGAEGPLGPQWSLSLGAGQSIRTLSNGSAELRTAGEVTTFASNGKGGFVSPKGDGNLTLEGKTASGKVTEYILSEPTAGKKIGFTLPTGSQIWVPTTSEGPGGHEKIKYGYAVAKPASGTVTEPTEVLGPVPSGVTCGENPAKVKLEELKSGCRALTFAYATSTTAKGEAESEWGEYEGRLTQIRFTGANPSTKAMETVTVADYAYDAKGRLRAEWDPRVSPALKTTYGYDSEGHVTAMTSPGHESWAMTYGTIARDPGSGRLIKVTHAPASAKLWSGEAVVNSEAPHLSGTAVVGVRMAVSEGQWSGEPIAYGYQWESCNAAGGECAPIAGATNANYTPKSGDVGHTLVATVTATGGDGSIAAASKASAVVASTWTERSASTTQLIDGASSINAVSCVPNTTECVLSDSKGNAFYATNVSATSSASWHAWSGPASPSEALACPSSSLCLMAAGTKSGDGGALYYATSLGGTWTLATNPSYGVDAVSCASTTFCVEGQDAADYVRWSTSPASSSWNLEAHGSGETKGVSCLSSSFCATVDNYGNVFVATSESQLQSTSWTETNLDGSSLNGIACTSTSSCVAVDGAGDVLSLAIGGTGVATATKQDVDGTTKLTAVSCVAGSTCAAVDASGNVFVSANAGETWKKEFSPGVDLTSVSCASSSLCVATDTAGKVTSFDPTLTQSVDGASSLNAISCVPSSTTCVVSDASGNAYYATNVSAKSAATWHSWTGPKIGQSEAVDCPSSSLCLMADGEHSGYGGSLYYATSLGGTWTEAYEPSYGVDAIACSSASFCIDGQDGYGYFRWASSPASTSWNLEDQGPSAAAMKGAFCLSASFCALADSVGSVHVAVTESQVRSSSWTESSVDGSTALDGIACTSTSSCVAVDSSGDVLNLAIGGTGSATATKHDIDGTTKLTAVSCSGSSTCAAVDASGNVFVSTNAGETWSREYRVSGELTSVSCASASLCAAVDSSGRVSAFDPQSAQAGSSYTQSLDGGASLNAVSCIAGSTDCVIGDGNGNAFYATNVSTTGTPSWKEWTGPGAGPSEAVDCPSTSLCLLAAGEDSGDGGNLYYATSFGGGWTTAYEPSFGVDAIACASASFCIDGQNGYGYFRWASAPASSSWYLEDQGSSAAATKGAFCLSNSFCALADSAGNVHVAVTESQVRSASWIETKVDGSTALNGIACTSTSSCVAVDGQGDVVNLAIGSGGAATASKQDIDGTNSLNAISCSGSTCAAVDGKGNVFTSNDAGQSWTAQYAPGGVLNGVSCASKSLCVAVSREGEATALDPSGDPSAAERSPQPGTTIEYEVPISGEGAPHQMTSAELAKWAQKNDLPVEATAIFPADEPQGWPASDYRRATIDYLDARGRRVNTAAPSGGISTVEYNAVNEVERELSADNRATALAEGCESEHSCKSAKAAEALSGRDVYNSEGTELLETYGPEHAIRLSDGTEEETRDRQKLSYNEGAPTGEAHDLVTKAVEWSETSSGKNLDQQETKNSYSGQEDLGWALREPTLTTTTAEGQTASEAMTYDATTGDPVEAVASMSVGAPVPASQFGQAGAKEGQLNDPTAAAIDRSGDVWVTDSANNRLDEFTAAGTFIRALGFGVSNGESKFESCASSCEAGLSGAGAGEFSKPRGIAVNQSTGDVYVVDEGNDRVEELNEKAEYLRAFGAVGTGKGDMEGPVAVAINPNGSVWIADFGNDRVDEFGETGEALGSFGSLGTGAGKFKGPAGIAFSDGSAYVVDQGDDRVEVFTSAGVYANQFGGEGSAEGLLSAPSGIASDPVSGDLFVTDGGNDRVEQFDIAGVFVAAFGSAGKGNGQFEAPEGAAVSAGGEVYVPDPGNDRVQEWELVPESPAYTSQFGAAGSEQGQFKEPRDVAMAADGNVLVLDSANGRVQELTAQGAYHSKFGSTGTGAGQMSEPAAMTVDAKGNVWIADTGNDRVDEFNEKGEFVSAFGYGVSNGESKLELCTTTCRAGTAGGAAGELSEPQGIAVTATGAVYVSDSANNRVEEYTQEGKLLAAFGFGVSNGKAEYEICASSCQAGVSGSGEGQFFGPRELAVSANGNLLVLDTWNDRVEQFNEKDEYVSKLGSAGTKAGQLDEPRGIAVSASGNILVSNAGDDSVQEFAPSGAFVLDFGTKGSHNSELDEPKGLAISASGAIFVADTKNERVERWTQAPRPGNNGAEITRFVYYTAGSEAEAAACRNHPEWTGLVCQTEPTAQPGDAGPPALPVTTTTYNIWDEPVTVTEQIGSVTRTTRRTYDGAGRETGSEETSTSHEDASVPAVTNEYSAETGVLTTQKETLGGETKAITSVYNTLGELASYTDAEGATTKYSYDLDDRVTEIDEPKGSQLYSYDSTSGALTKLVDSAAGEFTATYDVEGNIATESYPNGMTAHYTRNSIGQATGLRYVKTTGCSENCVWFEDDDSYGPQGELGKQVSSLSSEAYEYGEEGQLARTQETPVGGSGCITRLYQYSEESGQRTSSTTREPGEGGACASEGGVVEGHFYDSAGRLIDPGVTYDPLGNTTKLPAIDTGGAPITSSFYADNQVATQEQEGTTIDYAYDPAGRKVTAQSAKLSGTTIAVSHYAGPEESLTWTCEETGGGECARGTATEWTRNIPGIDGALDAIETNGQTPVLQIHDLQGDIVATAADNQSATKLLSTQNSTEFGVPTGGSSAQYSWLGADGLASELGTGVITEEGATYVPQLAATLQTEEALPPGAEPIVTAGAGDYTTVESAMAIESGQIAAANTLAEQRALETVTFVDPTEEMNRKKAEEKGEALMKLSSEAEVLSYFDIPTNLADYIEGKVLDVIVVDSAVSWVHEAGLKLEECGVNKHNYPTVLWGPQPDNICEFIYEKVKVGGWEAPLVYFGTLPRVKECYKTPISNKAVGCEMEIE
jgi:YD repeat-containing protein